MERRTYRDIIREIIPDTAIAEAERRVYDQQVAAFGSTRYACRAGYCALGVMRRSMYPDQPPVRFPAPYDLLDQRATYDAPYRIRRTALAQVIQANDRGQLATPGSLTALLDTELRAVVL